MIQITGSQLSQWDVGRSVCVSDSKATHVHFANQGDSKAPIIKIENGEAKIPDYLLQTGKALNAYAVLDGVTLESRSFAVRKRARPENYVYEDDQRNYLYELITNAENAVVNANKAAEKLRSICVTVTDNGEGDYVADLPHDMVLEAHNAGRTVYCQYGNRILSLIVASEALCSFGCIHSGNIYTVYINRASTTVSIVPLASGGGGADGITPHIGENGNWFIGDTDTGMPSQGEAGPQGLPGQDGKDGVSGVYVGSGEMPAGYNIQIDPTGEAPVLVQSVNGVKPDPSGNVEIKLPESGGGGGNVSYFETELTTEEDLQYIDIQLPVATKDFFLWCLAFTTPDTGEDGKINVCLWIGGGNRDFGEFSKHLSGIITGIKNGNQCAIAISTRPDEHLEHVPVILGGTSTYYDASKKLIELWTRTTDAAYPAGTNIKFWGVYHQ